MRSHKIFDGNQTMMASTVDTTLAVAYSLAQKWHTLS
jgi:hypothetical protein